MFYESPKAHGKFHSMHDQPQPSQNPLKNSHSITDYCEMISSKAKTISTAELTRFLDKFVRQLKNSRGEEQLGKLNDILYAIIPISASILVSVAQHTFFTLLQTPFAEILQSWIDKSQLNEDQSFLFRVIPKLLKKLFKNTNDIDFYPSWPFDSSFIKIIGSCLTNISKPNKNIFEHSQIESKNFIRLFSIYIDHLERLNNKNISHDDTLIELIDPTIHCLSSQHYIDSFDIVNIKKKSLDKKGKFFLLKCPSFILSYHGSRIHQVINNLLSTMLPKYIYLLHKVIPYINEWSHAAFRAVNDILKIVNHRSTNVEIVVANLPFIDHILTLINTQNLYNNLEETLSNPETNLMNTAVHFLANIVNEPTILGHIKQKNVTPSFLRLTSALYKPLQYNIYTLLANVASENDIKSMDNPGILLSTTLDSLKAAMDENPDDQRQIEQLLETLKGLLQHDQIKDEVLKQNAVPFLLDCANKFTDEKLKLVLEALWSLSFSRDAVVALRFHSELLDKIQKVSQTTDDEAMKKASEGLTWKLVEEPVLLEKVAKQQEKNKSNEMIETTETIIGPDGKEQVITKKVPASSQPSERTFQYDMMISYCHADKDLVYKIHQFLKDQSFKIWIDLNNMFGPAMSAMAEAVENSEFVIMCMSDSYKKSTYCQAEAEYAFNCKRRLVPLIVRPGYRADGWLGFMIGSRIYIDFGRFNFDTACEKLMNEINLQKKRSLPPKETKVVQEEKPVEPVKFAAPPKPRKLSDTYTKRTISSNFKKRPIYNWTEADVNDFLYDQHLRELMPLCEKMDGQALIQLYKMCAAERNETYTLLNDDLKSTKEIKLPIGVYTRFLSVMERITTPVAFPLSIEELSISSSPLIVQQYPSNPSTPYSNAPYDILVTSNASPLQMFQMVHNFIPSIQPRSYAKCPRKLSI
ncbi:unnamed protein product [Rotaria sp. Silwood2]|nr:unnamed protein product [Rotaria sp. Silwood2]